MPRDVSVDQQVAPTVAAVGDLINDAPNGASAVERQPLGMPSAKSLPLKGQPANTSGASQSPTTLAGTVRTVLSLAGVVAIIVGMAYGFKRLARGSDGLMSQLGAGGKAPSGVLSILGRYPVARGTTLVLLKADRRVLLLCQSSGKGITAGCTMQTLTEFTDPEDVASILLKTRDDDEDSLAQRFEAILSREDKSATRALATPTSVATPVRAASAKPLPTRAARAAAKHPEAVLRPSTVPSDPRAQVGREPERAAARVDGAMGAARPTTSGPLLRGVVA